MKVVVTSMLLLILARALAGCNASREIQADFVNAELIKIDTIYRYPRSEMLLTWRCQNNVQFVSFVPMNQQYFVGSICRVLLTK